MCCLATTVRGNQNKLFVDKIARHVTVEIGECAWGSDSACSMGGEGLIRCFHSRVVDLRAARATRNSQLVASTVAIGARDALVLSHLTCISTMFFVEVTLKRKSISTFRPAACKGLVTSNVKPPQAPLANQNKEGKARQSNVKPTSIEAPKILTHSCSGSPKLRTPAVGATKSRMLKLTTWKAGVN